MLQPIKRDVMGNVALMYIINFSMNHRLKMNICSEINIFILGTYQSKTGYSELNYEYLATFRWNFFYDENFPIQALFSRKSKLLVTYICQHVQNMFSRYFREKVFLICGTFISARKICPWQSLPDAFFSQLNTQIVHI
jgi:hypothetical protein